MPPLQPLAFKTHKACILYTLYTVVGAVANRSDRSDSVIQDDEGNEGIEEGLSDMPPPPSHSHSSQDTLMIIVDRNGVHKICVHWCQCPNAEPKDIQLLRSGLYPVSYKDPKTAFTTQVLDDFLIDNLECKTSASNHHSKLCRTTSNAFPHTVPVSLKLSILPVYSNTLYIG